MDKLHVAFIMDGNRRWAVEQGKSKLEGHKHGADNLKNVLKWCKDLNVNKVTLYALSTENLKRTPAELQVLFKLFEVGFNDLRKISEDVKIKFLGRLDLLPNYLQKSCMEIEDETKENSEYLLQFCVAYGGRQEIVDACNKAIENGEKVNEDTFSKYLYTPESPDLVIRTGGAIRTSNFLPYQTAYSEWFFPDSYWPAFSKEEFVEILDEFSKRKRNFGK